MIDAISSTLGLRGLELIRSTELFCLALKECVSEAQWDKAAEEIIHEVMDRYPELETEQIAFGVGRAVRRIEEQKRTSRL
jgi:hypothetical protein